MSIEQQELTEATGEKKPESSPEAGLEQTFLEKLAKLSPEKQRQLLDFAEFLVQKDSPVAKPVQALEKAEEARETPAPKRPRDSVRGLWANIEMDLTDEDIDEVRREMWANFPRDIEL